MPKTAVIVGAGFAGLAAARRLSQSNDWKVIVLEGGNRVGGRAHSVNVGSESAVELGATWIHGIGKGASLNPMYELAIEFGLLPECNVKGAQWRMPDVLLPYGRPLTPALLEVLQASYMQFSEGIEEAHDRTQGSVHDVLLQHWQQLLDSTQARDWTVEQRTVAAAVWRWQELKQRAIDGCSSTTDMGCISLHQYRDWHGSHITIPYGFQTLAERLAADVHVHFGQRVQQISYRATGCTVTCHSGAVYHADAVVVTVSLGVLKAEHSTLFDPPLPDWKVAAIEAMGMGVVDKMLVTVTKPAASDRGSISTNQRDVHHATQPARDNGIASKSTQNGQCIDSQKQGGAKCQFPVSAGPTQRPPQANTVSVTSDMQPQGQPALIAAADLSTGTQAVPLGTSSVGAQHVQGAALLTASTTRIVANGETKGSEEVEEGNGVGAAVDRQPPSRTQRRMFSTLARQTVNGTSRSNGRHTLNDAAADATDETDDEQDKHSQQSDTQHSEVGQAMAPSLPSFAFLRHVDLCEGPPWASSGETGTLRAVQDVDRTEGETPSETEIPLRWTDGVSSMHFGGHGFLQYRRPDSGGDAVRGSPGSLPSSARGTADTAGADSCGREVAVTVRCGPSDNLAMLWLTGEHAVAMECVTEHEALVEELQQLMDMYMCASSSESTPGSGSLGPAPMEVKSVATSRWGRDPLFRGSYSYMTSRCTPEVIAHLAAPVGPLDEPSRHPVLLFAGEATHATHFGTTHGAYLTGLREAERLLQMYNNM